MRFAFIKFYILAQLSEITNLLKIIIGFYDQKFFLIWH